MPHRSFFAAARPIQAVNSVWRPIFLASESDGQVQYEFFTTAEAAEKFGLRQKGNQAEFTVVKISAAAVVDLLRFVDADREVLIDGDERGNVRDYADELAGEILGDSLRN